VSEDLPHSRPGGDAEYPLWMLFSEAAHTVADNVRDLQTTQFGPAWSGRVQIHQHGAMHQVPSRINKPKLYDTRKENKR